MLADASGTSDLVHRVRLSEGFLVFLEHTGTACDAQSMQELIECIRQALGDRYNFVAELVPHPHFRSDKDIVVSFGCNLNGDWTVQAKFMKFTSESFTVLGEALPVVGLQLLHWFENSVERLGQERRKGFPTCSAGLYAIPPTCVRKYTFAGPPTARRYVFFVRSDGAVQVELLYDVGATAFSYLIACSRGGVGEMLELWYERLFFNAYHNRDAKSSGLPLNEAAFRAAVLFGAHPTHAVHGPVVFGWDRPSELGEIPANRVRFGLALDMALDIVRKLDADGGFTFFMEDQDTRTLVEEALGGASLH